MMSTFVQGKIVEKYGIPGVYHELKLRLLDGETIPIFYDNLLIHISSPDNNDDVIRNDPISPLLKLEESYNLLLIVRARKVKYVPEVPPGTVLKLVMVTRDFSPKTGGHIVKRKRVLQGKVLDFSWNPGSEQYQAAAFPEIYDYRYVLVETAIGKAILSREDLKEDLGEEMVEQITAGGYLEWSPARLDILAVL